LPKEEFAKIRVLEKGAHAQVYKLLEIAVSVCFAALAVLAGGAVLPQPHTRVVHVFVALADNQHQGIVPVSSRLGNGQDAASNLYWGAAFGVKTFFKASSAWRLLKCSTSQQPPLPERCVFRHQSPEVILVADAFRDAVSDFVSSAAGLREETLSLTLEHENRSLPVAGGADLLAYIGHDAFMDFQIPRVAGKTGGHKREFVILACASKPYFGPYMRDTQSEPLLWTTGLMAPEAYTLQAALEGWTLSENNESIRQGAASA
jgi:hypothetical protein